MHTCGTRLRKRKAPSGRWAAKYREEKGKIRASHPIEGPRFRQFQMVTAPNLLVVLHRLLDNVQKRSQGHLFEKNYDKTFIPNNIKKQ